MPVADPALREIFAGAQALGEGRRALYLSLARVGVTRPLSKVEWTAVIVLARVAEALDSATLLLSHDRTRDASVLLLTALELQYDLQYISLDHSRAADWLGHSDEGRKPWSVRKLLAALYSDAGERESAMATYRHLSTIKHGNPVSATASFPVAALSGGIIYSYEQPVHSIAALLFVGATLGQQVSEHAVSCFATPDPESSTLLTVLCEQQAHLSRLFQAVVVRAFVPRPSPEA